jgi:DNA invertase Pin-like site-specific DNA recombinase
MKCAIYARVSTVNGGQDVDLQLVPLREYAAKRGWEVAAEYVDHASGATDKRPGLSRLMQDARQRKFDVLCVWKLDRWGRSLQHLVNSLKELQELGITFTSLTDSFDLTTSQGRLMYNIVGSMAQFERDLIRERVKAGIAAARLKGFVPGPKKFKLDLDSIRGRIASGESMRAVARSLHVSPALLSKRLKAHS